MKPVQNRRYREAAHDLGGEHVPEYLAEAERHILKARGLGESCLGDALLRLAVSYERLAPATVRRYRQEVAVAVALGVARGEIASERAPALLSEIEAAFAQVVRCSTGDKKHTDWNPDEIDRILAVLDAEREDGDDIDDLIYLLVRLGLRIGWRPSEGLRIAWAGAGVIEIRSAKTGGPRGFSTVRRIDIERLGPDYAALVDELIAVVARATAQGVCLDGMLDAAKSRLRRRSKRACGRPLSLQALRHLCRKSLTDAGADDDIVALLLGHASLETARRWYARCSTGLLPLDGFDILPVVDDPAIAEALAAGDGAVERDAHEALASEPDNEAGDAELLAEAPASAAADEVGERGAAGASGDAETGTEHPSRASADGRIAEPGRPALPAAPGADALGPAADRAGTASPRNRGPGAPVLPSASSTDGTSRPFADAWEETWADTWTASPEALDETIEVMPKPEPAAPPTTPMLDPARVRALELRRANEAQSVLERMRTSSARIVSGTDDSWYHGRRRPGA